ncbi:MAG: apolipoprotein N-acyltransferase [Deltaproteobacteria bacterium]|nr:apolipoprotein N-acyltransferase [Deltaproteobacteria bacterium]
MQLFALSSSRIMKGLRHPYSLAAFSGVLFALSFPTYSIFISAWIFLVPLLFALPEKSSQDAARLGFVAGFLGNLGVVYWVVHSVHVYGNVPLFFSIIVMLVLVTYLAFYFSAFAVIASHFLVFPHLLPFVLAFAWVLLEYAKGLLFTGFPWENLGYSQMPMLPLVQIADIGGVYVVSFLVVFANSSLFLALAYVGRKMIKCIYTLLALLLIAGTLAYGSFQLNYFHDVVDLRMDNGIPVALLQGNIPQDIKWEPSQQEHTIQRYRSLATKANISKGIIVFPEAAMPFLLDRQEDYKAIITEVMRSSASWGIVGSLALQSETPLSVSNSAFVISPAGKITERYDKVHLVPFGEYVPRWVPFVQKLVAGIGDIQPGTDFRAVQVGNIAAGILICYETIFPAIAREYVLGGATLLVSITNDGWFGNTSAPFQHMNMATMRAIESRRFLLRVANTGISAIVSPTGKILAKTEVFETALLVGNIVPLTKTSIYSRHGDWFVFFCLLGISLAWIAKLIYLRSKRIAGAKDGR